MHQTSLKVQNSKSNYLIHWTLSHGLKQIWIH